MNNFTSQPTKQKDDFFMSTYFKLIMIALLTVTVLTACGDGSDKLPKIISVTYLEEENRIVVDATDDVKVTGYLLTKLDGEPKLDDSTWRQSNVFNDITPGFGAFKFNVWVKDEDNNLVRSEIVFEDPIVALAKDYEFLQWYLDDATSKTVDGVVYNLTELKQQYGDLYRFVEPLSKEEVEYRFKYLIEYFAEQSEKGAREYYAGGLDDVSDNSFGIFAVQINSYYKKMGTTNDKELIRYEENYIYSERLGRYIKILGPDFGNLLSNSDTKTIIEKSSFEDKKWYVMQYMTEVDMLLNILKTNDEKPDFVISPKQ